MNNFRAYALRLTLCLFFGLSARTSLAQSMDEIRDDTLIQNMAGYYPGFITVTDTYMSAVGKTNVLNGTAVIYLSDPGDVTTFVAEAAHFPALKILQDNHGLHPDDAVQFIHTAEAVSRMQMTLVAVRRWVLYGECEMFDSLPRPLKDSDASYGTAFCRAAFNQETPDNVTPQQLAAAWKRGVCAVFAAYQGSGVYSSYQNYAEYLMRHANGQEQKLSDEQWDRLREVGVFGSGLTPSILMPCSEVPFAYE